MANSDYIFLGKVIPCGFAENNATNIILSLCLNINGECGLLDPDSPSMELNYKTFYSAIIALSKFSKAAIQSITIEKNGSAAQTYSEDKIVGYKDPLTVIGGLKAQNWDHIKKELYQNIFACDAALNMVKNVHKESRFRNFDANDPTNFYSNQNLPNYSAFKKLGGLKGLKQKQEERQPSYRSVLNNIFKTADHFKSLSKAEFTSFVLRNEKVKHFVDQYSTSGKSQGDDLIDGIYKTYLDENTIDIDEIIHNFNIIASDPVLGRLFGFIIDFQITIPESFLPRDAFHVYIDVKTELKLGSAPHNWQNQIYMPMLSASFILGGNNKYALVPGDTPYSNCSVLVAGTEGQKLISLTSYDKIKAEEQLATYVQNKNSSEVIDGFTRGVICYHEELHKLIKPIKELPIILSADELSQGLRTAVGIIDPKQPADINWHSLTNRNLTVSYRGKTIYQTDNAEGCIHIDNPMTYMDEQGNLQFTTATAMFEYSEGLLSLKSAFAPVTKITKNEELEEKQNNLHDGGLKKSEARFKNKIGIYKFPFTEKEQAADLKFLYDIPKSYLNGHSPKLRFGNEYTFVSYYAFANGWSMPLSTKVGSCQLSVTDYIKYRTELYPKPLTFLQLENFKPVLLFPTKEIKQDDGKTATPINDKESIDELVIRSNDLGDSATESIRHILPERISLEHAFWFNLLSEPNMNDDDSYLWKRKYNCEYHKQKDYEDFINGKKDDGTSAKNTCSEGCKKWCGATTMETHYTNDFIRPNHLSHPDVNGFTIKLCWQKDFKSKTISLDRKMNKAKFGGQSGISPKSCRLTLSDGKEEIYVKSRHDASRITVAIKPGSVIYCRLVNQIDKKRKGIWTGDKLNVYETNDEADYNMPKELKLVYAVKRPLMVPKIVNLASTPTDHSQIEHLENWLKRQPFETYKLNQNIIATRVSLGPGQATQNSSIGAISLICHFERLDAYKEGDFLDGVTPTGSLELWMRKEEYIDDPDQIVLNPSTSDYNEAINHLPDKPIRNFQSAANTFSLEYKINFNNGILQQLKDLKKVQWLNKSNAFISVISQLQLEFDLKTTKFEEREYYLKDISKFKGYFANEKLNNENTRLDELDEFALPRSIEVLKNSNDNSLLRFKVLVLNNRQPQKPDIAYAITVIQEKRSMLESKTTVSVQKGNIVTIYLKRGRLTSGKNERVGLIVDSASLYNDLFKANNWISKAGSDNLTDRFITRSQFLQYGDVLTPQANVYQVEFDDELGIYHFLPAFDIEKQLWKFEVELNIETNNGRQLHNPFINFALVHYQPMSLNYNNKPSSVALADLKKDCRLSDVDNSTWCYLLPERKLSVSFDKPNWITDKWGNISLTINFDFESLHHSKINGKWEIHTNFILTVEGSRDSIIWHHLNSQIDDDNEAANWRLHHFLLSAGTLNKEQNFATIQVRFQKSSNPSHIIKDTKSSIDKEANNLSNAQKAMCFSKFRVRFFEVEWFTHESWDKIVADNPDMLTGDPINNEKLRVRYIEVIY